MTKLRIVIGFIYYRLSSFFNYSVALYKSYLFNNHMGTKNIWIGHSVYFSNLDNIEIGENSYINGGELRASPAAKITIGENCLISYNVHLRSDTHRYSRNDIPIIQQGNDEKSITIGNDVWIGHSVQIMPGVSIGNGSIIGAGSIVTKSFGDNVIIAGVPARVIKKRFS